MVVSFLGYPCLHWNRSYFGETLFQRHLAHIPTTFGGVGFFLDTFRTSRAGSTHIMVFTLSGRGGKKIGPRAGSRRVVFSAA